MSAKPELPAYAMNRSNFPDEDFRFGAIVAGIVDSAPFCYRERQ